jgi:hypothetical protein
MPSRRTSRFPDLFACFENKKTPPRRWSLLSSVYQKSYGLKRNFSLPRLAASFAFRRTFCDGVSKARKRRTSSMIPSASSLFFSLLSALSIGSPFLTITSGIKILFFRILFVRGVNSSRGFSERQSIKRKSFGGVQCQRGLFWHRRRSQCRVLGFVWKESCVFNFAASILALIT